MFAAGLSFDVIDPCNRTGKIRIPAQHVEETKGLTDFCQCPERREGKELSLCLLFQRGRCNAGSRCHQVHADAAFVAQLRDAAAATRNCCAAHGDVHSSGLLAGMACAVVRIVGDGELAGRTFSLDAFARTSCLDNCLRAARAGQEVRVPGAKLCRLHAQHRCKFGKDCRNVHLCPSAAATTASPPMPLLPIAMSPPAAKKPAPLSALDTSSTCSSAALSVCESPLAGAIGRRASASSFTLESAVAVAPPPPMCSWAECGVFALPPSPSAVAALDMSEFEATMRAMCADLLRAECSPHAASKVKTREAIFA